MVWGTSSGAGKSWLVTALCRWYARQGLRVAPFKAQNMSNNARVVATPHGGMGEIGSAQYFQALASRIRPDVRMNPVLLKPEHDTGSQVVVMGEVDAALSRAPWRERSDTLWAHAQTALHSLQSEVDVLVIEGAGSPAEINLQSTDYVNLRTASAAQASGLLVTDIDRGGAFAHLYGTHQLMPAPERALLRGFVLNRFRGDATLLAPGPQQLQDLTGVPTVAVLPMWRGHGLPEEDGVFDDTPCGDGQGLRIAIVAYPRLSNLDEFQPLRNLPHVCVHWAREPRDVDGADWIILPGSKHTSGDLRWLRAQRLDAAIARHAAAGKALLGICGGLQMLGEALVDPDGVEGCAGEGANQPGLGRLPLVTRFMADKRISPTSARFSGLVGTWAKLNEVALQGYEIHHGRTVPHPGLTPATVVLYDAQGAPLGWQVDNTLGLYAHGLFESDAVLQALFGSGVAPMDRVFDGLADVVEAHFKPGFLANLVAYPGS